MKKTMNLLNVSMMTMLILKEDDIYLKRQGFASIFLVMLINDT